MKKAYYLLFYKLYCYFRSLSPDGWEPWKALLIIGGAEGVLFVELVVWYTIITKEGIQFQKFGLIVLGLFIAILNYYIFIRKDHWKKYEEEFKHYSKKKNIAIGWVVFLFLFLVLASVIFAFYQMSLIDWSKYR